MLDFLNTLRKLRLIRRQHARDKGQFSREDDPTEKEFIDEVKKLEETIKKHKALYENEKRKLIGKS